MSVLILGVGSAIPTEKRNPSGQLLKLDNHHYLIDCGEGTQIRLRQNKVSIQKINHIFISHLHGDHYLGLMGLLWTMTLLGRTNALTIFGPPKLKEIIDLHLEAAAGRFSFEGRFVSTDVPEGTVIHEDKKVTVTTIKLKHKIPCTGFIFREKEGLRKLITEKIEVHNIPYDQRKGIKQGKDYYDPQLERWIPNGELTTDPPIPRSYAYCTDTAYLEKLIPKILQVDLLYHEATFLDADQDKAKATRHSTALEAATIAKKADVGKLILGHYSNRYIDLQPILDEAREVFDRTVLGEEGCTYDVV